MAAKDRIPKSPFDDSFNASVQHLLAKWQVPGLSIAVIDGDETFAKGYGIAKTPDVSTTPETLFFAASTTKSFTAAAVAILIDDEEKRAAERPQAQPSNEQRTVLVPDGRGGMRATEPLAWNTLMSDLLPEDFVLSNPEQTRKVTLLDALCHCSGVPNHENSFGPKTWGLTEVVHNLRHLPLTADVGEKFMYNDIMYSAISLAIEKRTGQGLGDFLRERIWKPLGMNSTLWTLADALKAEGDGLEQLARGYALSRDQKEFVEETLPDFPCVSGSGAIISNVLDYTKWLRCMFGDSSILSVAARTMITQPRMKIFPPRMKAFSQPNQYACGWFVDDYYGRQVIWHTGGWTGFGSIMAYLPSERRGIVMMGNTSRTSNYVQLTIFFRMLDDLVEKPLHERADWESVWYDLWTQPQARNALAQKEIEEAKKATGRPVIPLDEYEGYYSHPGYGVMHLVASGESLIADRMQQEIPIMVRVDYISGEAWKATLEGHNSRVADWRVVEARFSKGNWLELDLEPLMEGKMIQFQRVDPHAGAS